jgi:muramoyltetrapeptide carboxypeptidase LdcA involved in peptidoglycan recycling
MKRIPTEKELKAVVERLKAKNPDWDLHVEFGKLLMKHIDDFTDEERKRYDELKEILTKRKS